ncbi:MAG: MFS transporter [Candidatus Omnitrophica bacterium]|nr:MFS transporter [Candidatus Omnitrophota bacterium]MDD4013858.1 MFS transporter [Candidatus Omnitrophota bacterium]
MVRLRDVLFNRNFFPLWAGQIVSEFGDRLTQMALISLVYHFRPGSVMALANALLFTIIPVFVIGPVAGVYVDRWDRKTVMIISDVIRGLFVLAMPFFIWIQFLPGVYILVFLVFSATRFFLPSKMAFIPDIIEKEKVMVANSLSNTTRMIATVLGFALAGFLVSKVGYTAGFFLNAATFFVSAALIASITPKEKYSNVKKDLGITKELLDISLRKNVWGELVEGFLYMFSRGRMKVVTGALFTVMAGTGAVFCVIIVFVQQSFGSVTEALGLLGVFLGMGLFIGTVVYGKFGQRLQRVRSIFLLMGLTGVFVILFAYVVSGTSSLILSGLVTILMGAAAGPIFACTATLMHVLVPKEAHGRIFSSMEIVMHLAFLLFMLLSAKVAKLTSNFTILIWSGAIFACIGSAGFFLSRKESVDC